MWSHVHTCTVILTFTYKDVQECSKIYKFFTRVEQNEYWLTPNWLKSVQIKPQILFFVIQTVNASNRKAKSSKGNHKKGSKTSWQKEKWNWECFYFKIYKKLHKVQQTNGNWLYYAAFGVPKNSGVIQVKTYLQPERFQLKFFRENQHIRNPRNVTLFRQNFNRNLSE